MSKVITISLAQAGGDISTVDIYHTAIDSGSLLASNVSASLLTGSGIQYTVDDAVDTFFAVVNDGGECDLTSGSFSGSFFRPSVRYLYVEAVGASEATVSITSPVTLGPTTGSLEYEADFKEIPFVTLYADTTPGYPVVSNFVGWYTQETGGVLHSTSETLTITLDTINSSDSFYARFS